jgi:hypothetical protein
VEWKRGPAWCINTISCSLWHVKGEEGRPITRRLPGQVDVAGAQRFEGVQKHDDYTFHSVPPHPVPSSAVDGTILALRPPRLAPHTSHVTQGRRGLAHTASKGTQPDALPPFRSTYQDRRRSVAAWLSQGCVEGESGEVEVRGGCAEERAEGEGV